MPYQPGQYQVAVTITFAPGTPLDEARATINTVLDKARQACGPEVLEVDADWKYDRDSLPEA